MESAKNFIDSIIFVCSGNTCRSPMAKYIMQKLLSDKGLSYKITVDSAGCNTLGGVHMNSRAQTVLEENKIPFDEHISKPFTSQEYGKFKCVIALDKYMLENAIDISIGDPENKIRLFKTADGQEMDIKDPFGAEDLKQAYNRAYKEIYVGCESLLKELIGE